MNFSWEALKASGEARKKILETLSGIEDDGKVNQEYKNKFTDFINDDLGTPQALALIFEVLKSTIPDANKKATILEFDKVLGIKLDEKVLSEVLIEVPIAIKNLLTERELARSKKDFARADALRGEIEDLGYKVLDSESGAEVLKK